jgi:hypothetical protein
VGVRDCRLTRRARRVSLEVMNCQRSTERDEGALGAMRAWRVLRSILTACPPKIKNSPPHYGEALLTAQRPELQPLIDNLRKVVQGRDDIRTECAGTIAGA